MEANQYRTRQGLIYLAVPGSIFSSFVPADYEAFRSITLPGLVLAATLIVFGQTKYAKKYQVRKKEADM